MNASESHAVLISENQRLRIELAAQRAFAKDGYAQFNAVREELEKAREALNFWQKVNALYHRVWLSPEARHEAMTLFDEHGIETWPALKALAEERLIAALSRPEGKEQEPSDADLLKVGYAPGGYSNSCMFCGRNASPVDKWCYVCRECAVRKFAEAERASAPAPQPKCEPVTLVQHVGAHSDMMGNWHCDICGASLGNGTAPMVCLGQPGERKEE